MKNNITLDNYNTEHSLYIQYVSADSTFYVTSFMFSNAIIIIKAK